MREALRLEEALHLHRPRPADPREVVAAEVDEHHVLGALLLGGEQALRVPLAGPCRARDRVQRGAAALGLHERLGRGADEREAVELEQEQVRRRIHPPQGAVELQRARRGRPLGALREHDLEGVARADVLLRAHDRALVRVARGQPPGRPGAAAAARPIGEGAVEQVGDRAGISCKHFRHAERVVEADERLRDDEAALGQAAARRPGSSTVGSRTAAWS